MSPGIVGGTEAIIGAAAAGQFFYRYKGQDGDPRSERNTYNSICIPVPYMTLRERRHVCDVRSSLMGSTTVLLGPIAEIMVLDVSDRAEEDSVTTHER